MVGPTPVYDAVVVGGGPAGATAAADLAQAGHHVVLLDKGGRIKPCGGGIPPVLLEEFDVPESLLVNRIESARMWAPSGRFVDMQVRGGYVGMVDRADFDPWLRERAARVGAVRKTGTFVGIERPGGPTIEVRYRPRDKGGEATEVLRTRAVIGADGAMSKVAQQEIAHRSAHERVVFAYHEIIRSPETASDECFEATRADFYYQGHFSPDFYAWVFPHGKTTSIGTGAYGKSFDLRDAIGELRGKTNLGEVETVRREGAPIPIEPLKRWDNGRDVVLAGDAAGIVAPSSGEGIYYAMAGGRFAARSVDEFLKSGKPRALRRARRRFLWQHGQVFMALSIMQRFWYANDDRRERFVAICNDRDVQDMSFEGYMHKKLIRRRPLAHARIFFKNIGHLTGWIST